jgi:FkbM family methyltransferase
LPQLDQGSVIFDVGAHVGDWALFALSLNSEINIHLFEPSKNTYRKLIDKTWPENVSLNNFGLGDVEEIKIFYLFDAAISGTSEMNSLYSRSGVDASIATETESISINTIDNYCLELGINFIHLLKVDVEGHELAVFKGMEEMLKKHAISCIQFEYGGTYLDAKTSLGDIYQLLEFYGFSFYKIYPKGLRHIDRYDQRFDTFKYSNWIAIHQDYEQFFRINILNRRLLI